MAEGKGGESRFPRAVKTLQILRAVVAMGSTLELERALDIACSAAVSVLDVDGCAALVYNALERSVNPVACVTRENVPRMFEERIWLRLPEGSALARALKRGKIGRFLPSSSPGATSSGGGLEATAPAEEIVDLSRFNALCIAPMVVGDGRDEAVGALILYNAREGGPSGRASVGGLTLSRSDRELLSLLAAQAAATVQRFELFSTLSRSEDKYKALTENAVDMVFALDRAGRFTFVNERTREILGREPSSLVGVFWSDLVEPESVEPTLKALEDARKSRAPRVFYEWIVARHDGEKALLEVSASLVWRYGEIHGQQGIARDVTERRKLQAEIARRSQELILSEERQQQMRDYVALVTRIQEEERRRIARELHDDTIQALIAAVRKVEAARACLSADVEGAARGLVSVENVLRQAVGGLRRVISDLRPAVLDDLGLAPALDYLVRHARKPDTEVSLELSGFATDTRLNPEIEIALFRIAQEALNNAVKHSQARLVKVSLKKDRDQVELTVGDDGKGFGLPSALSDLARSGRLGLIGMSERAHLLGGRFEVQSTPGSGSTVTVTIPLKQGHAPDTAGRTPREESAL